MSDNELVKLEGFPPLKRLSTLLVHNNRIARISAGLGGVFPQAAPPRKRCASPRRRPPVALPKLESLALANNRLANLGVRFGAASRLQAR